MISRRSTPTKDAVLEVLTRAGKAMSQDAIEQEIDIKINRATIYRVLNRFCEDGVLHKIVAEDGKQYFAIDVEGEEDSLSKHHFHFRCTSCEVIECLPFEVKYALPENYSVETVNCILTGTCKNCS